MKSDAPLPALTRPRRAGPPPAAVGVVVGFICMAGGFFYDALFAGIPHREPAPDLEAAWAFHDRVADFLTLGGLALIAVSLLAFLVPLLVRSIGAR